MLRTTAWTAFTAVQNLLSISLLTLDTLFRAFLEFMQNYSPNFRITRSFYLKFPGNEILKLKLNMQRAMTESRVVPIGVNNKRFP